MKKRASKRAQKKKRASKRAQKKKRASKRAQKKKQTPPRGCRSGGPPAASEQQVRLGGHVQQSLSDDSTTHETTEEDVEEEEEKEEEDLQLPRSRAPISNGLVFDISVLLRLERGVDAAISTLKAALTKGCMGPSALLYDELLACLADSETYSVARLIFSALIWVFDSEFGKSTTSNTASFPHELDPLMSALQDASEQPMGDLGWRQHLLVIKLFVYCLQCDFRACSQRNYDDVASPTDTRWVWETRLSRLLRDGRSMRAGLAEQRVRNDWILQAVGYCASIWKRIHEDVGNGEDEQATTGWCELEKGDAGGALLRLIEMLFRCTTQADNVVQRIGSGMDDMRTASRDIFCLTIQCEDLKVRIAAMHEIGVETLLARASTAPVACPLTLSRSHLRFRA